MPVTLQVTNGPSLGRKIYVGRGQITKIGRTEWADVSFPSDGAMADIHFEIHAVGPECLIRDSSGGSGTLVNGVVVAETRLHTGDLVTAGGTMFSIAVDGEAEAARAADAIVPATIPISPQKSDSKDQPPVAADLCRPLKLSDPAKELLADGMSPANYLELVVEHELYPDALRFLAFWLPRPVAVGWGCDCVEQVFTEKLTALDKAALDAARNWSKESSETNCRAAEKAAAETDFSGAASWLALAAFWSGNSLAPEGLPAVPPSEGLTAEAITGALILAATQGDPAQAFDRYRAFLVDGRQRLPNNS